MTRWLALRLLNTFLALGLASLSGRSGAGLCSASRERACLMFSMGLRITTSTCPPISSPVVWRKTSP